MVYYRVYPALIGMADTPEEKPYRVLQTYRTYREARNAGKAKAEAKAKAEVDAEPEAEAEPKAIVAAPAPAPAPATSVAPNAPTSKVVPATTVKAKSKPASVEYDEKYNEDTNTSRLAELTRQLEKCQADCKVLSEEKKQIEAFEISKQIEGISLPNESTLINLLIQRVLDLSPDWHTKIDTLINIPTSLKGEGLLRGGDYFEALFQLAIAINVLPQFNGKFVRFYDIKKYTALEEFANYLHTKPIRNSGGGEQGISDITFEISTNTDFSKATSGEYSCGELPVELTATQLENPFYFISVKGYKKEKSIKSEYDIPLLDQQLKLFPDKNRHIIVCVRDKAKFLTNLSRTRIDFLKNSINHVIGYDEVMEAFAKFRVDFFNKLTAPITPDLVEATVNALFPPEVIIKPMLSLYFHQELVVKSIMARIQEPSIPRTRPHFMCIGVLPRGGKSFIAGGIIDNHKKYTAKASGYNVLFLTSAVNETRSQFEKDLIKKFSDFADFEFVDVVRGKPVDATKPNKFYFVSRQLSSLTVKSATKEAVKSETGDLVEQGKKEPTSENLVADLIAKLEEKLGGIPEIDICFFDEAHVGITATTVRANFQKAYERFKVPIILMTATYKLPANFLDSTRDLFVWDLQDIKDMKALPAVGLKGFLEKTPDVITRYSKDMVEDILTMRLTNGEDEHQISKPYLQFPNPNFISLTFTPDTITHLKETGSGYSFTKAFEINPDKSSILLDSSKWIEWASLIRNREDALRLRQFLTPDQDPSDTFLTDKERKFRALNQIFQIAQKNGSRPMPGRPFSILMFLPFMFEGGGPIGQLCRIWSSFMLQSKYWRDNFVFLTLSTLNLPGYKLPKITDAQAKMNVTQGVARGLCHREELHGDLKDIIINVEREALKQGKGLVIVSGDVAKMGISLKCVDVVFLMSSSDDPDDLIQKMYRALTDNPPTKKDGFIVDLNLTRIIKAMFDYDLQKDKMRFNTAKSQSTEERLLKISEMCNWGQDSYIEDHPEMDYTDIMEAIKAKVLSHLEARIVGEYTESSEGTGRGRTKFEKEQIAAIFTDKGLYSDIWDVLATTAGTSAKSKRTTEKPEIIAARGVHIPKPAKEKAKEGEEEEEGGEGENEAEAEEDAPTISSQTFLTDDDLKQKTMNILKTFVNSLVYKSTEEWSSSLNLVVLLEKYNADKKLFAPTTALLPSCECSTEANCKTPHNNLYEAAYCELKNYAMKQVGTKQIYSPEIHAGIMTIIGKIFTNSAQLVNWNIYIEILLRELRTSKKGGNRRWTTYRKSKGIVGYGVRIKTRTRRR